MPADEKPNLDDFAAQVLDGGGVLGNYIVVAEIVHEEGTTMNFALSNGLPPWTAIGMLQATLGMLDFNAYGYMGIDDEDMPVEDEDFED